MRKIIPYIGFFCLTGFSVISGLPVMAGGCNSHMNKQAEIKCAEDDTECQTEKAENIKLNKTVKSWNLSQLYLIINTATRDIVD